MVIKSDNQEKRHHKRHRVYANIQEEPSPTQSRVLVIPARSNNTGTIPSSKHTRAVMVDENVSERTLTQSGVLIIPAGNLTRSKHARIAPAELANVMVIPSLDIKGTRLQIHGNWRGYTPAKIVGIFRKHYENMRSLAVMLSRIKKDLKGLDDPPPDEFLSKIAMGKKEYNEFRKLNNDVRKRGAMSV